MLRPSHHPCDGLVRQIAKADFLLHREYFRSDLVSRGVGLPIDLNPAEPAASGGVEAKNRKRVNIFRHRMEAAMASLDFAFMLVSFADLELKTTAFKVRIKTLDRLHHATSSM